MDEKRNLRLQKVENTQFEEKIKVKFLIARQEETDKALTDIKQIKYMLMGAFGFFILDKFGLEKVISLLLS